MTERAGDAVLRELIHPIIRAEYQMGKDLRFPAFIVGLIVRHGHVALRAFVFDRGFRFGVIEDLPADAGLPVGITRGIGHHCGPPGKADGNVFPVGRG